MQTSALPEQESADEKPLVVRVGYELFVVGLVLLSLVNGFLIFLLRDSAQQGVALIVQGCITAFLIVDACSRLLHARNKRRFLVRSYGWLYFLGSLPLPFLSVLRLVPTAILGRRLRRQDYDSMGRVVVQRRAQSTLLVVIFIAVLVLEAGSILVLGAEAKGSDPNIKTASDALWWGVVTIATVGYGDRYPTTNQGRIVGVFVIVVGVALFTSLSSFLAQWFLRQRAAAEAAQRDTQGQRNGSSEVTWEQVRAWLEQRESAHVREIEELRARLAVFEENRARQADREHDATP